MKCKITGNIKSKDQIAWKFLANKRMMLTYFRLLPNPNLNFHLKKGFNREPLAVIISCGGYMKGEFLDGDYHFLLFLK